MRIASITILKPNHPEIVIEKNPTDLTLSFLSTVLHSKYFNEELENLDEIISFKNRQYSYKNIHDPGAIELFKFLKSEIEFITWHYELPEWFTWQFFILIYFNSFTDLTSDRQSNLYYLSTQREIAELLDEDKQQNIGAIIFEQEITKEQLHKFIDEEWDVISEEMEQWLPVFPSEGSRFTNIIISDEIYDLFKQGNSVGKISNLLSDKYINDKKKHKLVSDEGWIKNKLSRYKKRIKKFDMKYTKKDLYDD